MWILRVRVALLDWRVWGRGLEGVRGVTWEDGGDKRAIGIAQRVTGR